jgi:predicted nucleic acid-binding protein
MGPLIRQGRTLQLHKADIIRPRIQAKPAQPGALEQGSLIQFGREYSRYPAQVARFSRRDQYHEPAAKAWAKLKASEGRMVTSDSVFVETITFLARNVSPTAAVEAGRFIHGWNKLTILRATKEDEAAAIDLVDKFADQSIGFVDCLSFALIRRHRIVSVFTFDRHFELAGVPLIH